MEYGLIVFAIAAVIVAILFLLGGVVQETYSGLVLDHRRARLPAAPVAPDDGSNRPAARKLVAASVQLGDLR